jgi:predicted HAD superfamily Cof-like phosphohydrolase
VPIAAIFADVKDVFPTPLRPSTASEQPKPTITSSYPAKNGDIVEIADALGDQLYILCGTILKHGLQYKIEEVFQEIQRSNMSKLDVNGQPIYREDGKVMKSELYFRPDIKSILEK